MITLTQVLSVLADLAPEGGGAAARRAGNELIAERDRAVVALQEVAVFASGPGPGSMGDAVQQLAARARLRADENLLRLGWLWVEGRTADGDAVRFPLVSAPVKLTDPALFTGARLIRDGDVEVTDRITDPRDRDRLESSIQFGGGAFTDERTIADPQLLGRLDRLTTWAADAAAATGFPDAALVTQPGKRDGVCVVAQAHVYLTESPVRSATIESSLRDWAERDVGESALAHLYVGTVSDPPPPVEPVESSLVLTPAQRAAVAEARHAPTTVISGPPGTGKTQTIAAIALDAVERGQSVLIGAPSTAAVEALIDLLTDVPGPDPVVFGGSVHRSQLVERLGQGGGPRHRNDAVTAAIERHRSARDDYRRRTGAVTDLLRAEELVGRADLASTLAARQATPNWFGVASPAVLAEAERLLARASTVGGLFTGYRRRRRLSALQRHAGSSVDDLTVFAEHLATARAVLTAADLTGSGGLDLAPVWDAVVAADEARRHARAELLDRVAHSEQRVDRAARGTMTAVAAALRAGRAARREMLGQIDGGDLTRALPLWIGTLRDIDDLLPRSAAMFDLVIIDEGSQVDQVLAAPALVRGRRAVVAGDPKQLRHVSFLADERVRAALREQRVDDPQVAARLDARRLSAFDLAASAAPVQFLDEHFRSLPHLVEFSARRFYAGRLTIATRHPRNDTRDCISVRHIDGVRGDDGVNRAEIDAVVELARAEVGSGRSVGVVSPFREHVDAIEERMLTEFDPAILDALHLRVGTVHGFQGCERDLLIVTLALDPTSPAGSLRFLADENLFNVMITRAREQLIVVTSLPADTAGLVGEYLRHGEAPPHPPSGAAPTNPLARRVVADLPAAAISATGYPAGRHTIDVVLGAGDAALGLLFGVHPDGPEAHIERHLALRRQGWTLREVFASRWGERPAELAVDLATQTP